jgi:hypothetical protein
MFDDPLSNEAITKRLQKIEDLVRAIAVAVATLGHVLLSQAETRKDRAELEGALVTLLRATE